MNLNLSTTNSLIEKQLIHPGSKETWHSDHNYVNVSNADIVEDSKTIKYNGEIFHKFNDGYWDRVYTNDLTFLTLLGEHIDKIRNRTLSNKLQKYLQNNSLLVTGILIGLGSITLTLIKFWVAPQ